MSEVERLRIQNRNLLAQVQQLRARRDTEKESFRSRLAERIFGLRGVKAKNRQRLQRVAEAIEISFNRCGHDCLNAAVCSVITNVDAAAPQEKRLTARERRGLFFHIATLCTGAA